MKRVFVAAAFLAASAAYSHAADLAARPYTKAPAVAPVSNWTGFYVFGGGGYGLWNAQSGVVATGGPDPAGNVQGPAGTQLVREQRFGGQGWFGTVGAGYDWQFSNRWVAGIFGDAQFGDIGGSISDPWYGVEGRQKLKTSYAGGVRLGYLVAPNVLSYFNAGYSGSEWSSTTLTNIFVQPGGPAGFVTTSPSFNRNGWFVGGGFEHDLNIFGIDARGWFLKTEYRSAFYDRISLPSTVTGGIFGAGPAGTAITFKPWVQTISTSLVYRF